MREFFYKILITASILAAIPARAGAGPRANGGGRGNAGARANSAAQANALLLSLPFPVRRTILSEMANGTLDSVSRTNSDDGDVIYDVDFIRLGRSRNMTVGLDGKLLDIQVFPEETPVATRRAIQTLSAGGQLGDITKNIDIYGDFTYDVELTRDGVAHDFTVDDDGVLLAMQVPLPGTPPSVQKTIQNKVAGDILGKIVKTIDEDETNYDVEMTQANRRRTFTVSTNGELVEEQVFTEEIPQAVQKTIQAQAKRGRLGKINHSTDEGKDYYEVSISIGLNTCRVTFDADGVFDSEEEDMAWPSLPPKVKIALHPIQVAGEQVNDIMRTTEGTNTTYDIELRKGPARRILTFDPDGKIVPP